MTIKGSRFFNIIIQFIFIAPTIFFASSTAYADARGLDQTIQIILDQGRDQYDLVAMQLSILHKGEIIPHDYVTGNIAKDHSIPITPNSLFQMGSITKSFTAALILKLEAEGVLSINDEIGMWLPQVPETWKKITIRQLLNHTSGLPDYLGTDFFAVFMQDFYHQFQPDELLQFVIHEPLRFPSGEGFSYSNTNYVLTGMVIDAALISQGKSYASELSRQIIKPLNLLNTFYLPHPYSKTIFNRMAHGYYPINFPDREVFDITAYNMSYTSTAGANVSNAHDVAIWMKSLIKGMLFSSTQWQEMTTMVDMITGEPTKSNGYGLGVYQQIIQHEQVWMHRGMTMGYVNGMYYLPCRDTVIAFTSTPKNFINIESSDGEEIIKKVISYIQRVDPKKGCQVPQQKQKLFLHQMRNRPEIILW